MLGQSGLSTGEGFETINFRGALHFFLLQWNCTFGLDRRRMRVPDFNDWHVTICQHRLTHSLSQSTKEELVGTNSKRDGSSVVLPTARTTSEIDSAAVGDQARLGKRLRCTQHDWVISVVCVHVTRRRKQIAKELVARTIGLFHGGFTPQVKFCTDHLGKRRQNGVLTV